MADNFLKVHKGLSLKPISADPANPIDGDLQFSDGTARPKGLWEYKDGSWQQTGSGGGGLGVFHSDDFETTGASDFTTGLNATYLTAGTFGGVLSNETASPISKDQSIKYTAGATSTNDWINWGTINVDPKQQSSDVGISFFFDTSSFTKDVEFVVWDITNSKKLNSSLDVITASTSLTRFSTSVFIPSNTTSISYGFHLVNAPVNGESFIFDDIQFSTNPFSYKDILKPDVYFSARGNDGSSYTPATALSFTEIIDTVGAWDGHTFTAPSTGYYDIEGSNAFTAASNYSIYAYIDNIQDIVLGFDNTTNAYQKFSGSVYLIAKQKLTIRSTISNTQFNHVGLHWLTISKSIQGTTENIIVPQKNIESEVRVQVVNGYGSTRTTTRRFTNVLSNTGDAILYSDSATLGASFEIKKTGVYFISYNDKSNGGATGLAISKNQTNLTLIASSMSGDTLLSYNVTQGAGQVSGFSWMGVLNEGDIIRAQTDGGAATSNSLTQFTIAKLGFQSLSAVPVQKVAYLKDIKASGTNGGSAFSGSWFTRDLNSVTGDTDIVSLTSNQFTLHKGKYLIEAKAPAYDVSRHQAKLVSDPSGTPVDLILGTNALCGKSPSTDVTTTSDIDGVIEILSTTVFEIQHQVSSSSTGADGLGLTTPFGVDEIYTTVKITKLK